MCDAIDLGVIEEVSERMKLLKPKINPGWNEGDVERLYTEENGYVLVFSRNKKTGRTLLTMTMSKDQWDKLREEGPL